MLNIAIVGTGWWGKELAKASLNVPEVIKLQGCTALTEPERDEFSAAFGGKKYDDLDAILAAPEVDAVLLATPHSAHWQQIIAAAAAKKHVFCEKPLALDVDTASKAIAACEENGLVLAVGHNRRFSDGAKKLKEIIDSGACGQVVHIEGHYSGNGSLKHPPDYWRAKRAENPGGAIAPMGLHMIDTLTWLLGPIARVVGVCKRQVTTNDIDDTAAALFELASGATGSFGFTFACPGTSSLRIYGTGGILEAHDNFSKISFQPDGADTSPIQEIYETDETVEAELTAFAEACGGGPAHPVKPSEALRNVAVMQSIVASSDAGGTWVDVPVQ